MREQIDALAFVDETDSEVPEDEEESVLSNVDIGSKIKPLSFSKLEQDMIGDVAFERFRIKFGDFVCDFLPAYGYALPNGRRLRFDGIDTVWFRSCRKITELSTQIDYALSVSQGSL